ncbi:MAG: sigma-70 family RNA polymerase sigma factor [Flavobacteriaceae bacterium]|nr:sigma-70 family RNA polymerase sigma factor [Flavobacteriaceae bacterium]
METAVSHKTQLIEKCLKGDSKAQFELYKKYYRAMFNTALRILNNRFEAEDVMQDAFLAAFTKLESYRGTVSFGAWLKRIVINKSLTALKKNNRMETIPLELVKQPDSEPVISKDQAPQSKTILTKMQTLKPTYKIALTLHLIEGYDYEEIAQIMDISYENSRTIIS